MRVLVLFNPRSGRGSARETADSIAAAARASGHEAAQRPADDRLDADALRAHDAVVLVGGDGTMHHALPALCESRVPVYHAGTGTENLFAREFAMSRRPRDVADALAAGAVREIDLLRLTIASGYAPILHLAAIMCSVGPDASVIHRVQSSRSGPITHAHYIEPILRELVSPSLPDLHIDADTRAFAHGRGGVIVANMRQYALRINPLPDAAPDDARLDAVFYPAQSGLGAAAWFMSARMGRVHEDPRVRVTRASRVRIRAAAGACLQADGEPVPLPDDALDLSVEIHDHRLRVLVPPEHKGEPLRDRA